MARVTARAELFSWEPGAKREKSQTVATAEEVASRAAELLRRYQQEMPDLVPGLSLVADDPSRGSLVIGVAPIGWSLTHNSEDYLTQHCTKSTGVAREPSIPVRWGEPTDMPRDRFIVQQLALEGVRYWLENGGLAPDLPWSDDCA